MDLRGETALVTGATGGLGRAISAHLAGRGARLVLSSRNGPELEQMVAELPGEHRSVVSDLAKPGAALALIGEAGDVGILVANAGLPGSGALDGLEAIHVERAVRVNLEAPMLMAQALVPPMLERGQGHLVFVGSLAGVAPTARASVYNATKFGLRGFALGLREDLRGTGVSSSVVEPGFVREAGMFADAGVKAPGGMGTTTPEAVAKAVLNAIERNRGEVAVAPWRQVRGARFAGRFPELAGRLTHRAALKAGDELAGNQTEKR